MQYENWYWILRAVNDFFYRVEVDRDDRLVMVVGVIASVGASGGCGGCGRCSSYDRRICSALAVMAKERRIA